MRAVGIIVWLLGMSIPVLAQQQTGQPDPAIEAVGAIVNGQVVLRWAPNTSVTWEYANRYGYTVERYTVLRDSLVVPNPAKVVLTPSGLKPWPLEAWESFVDEDDFAPIAAQALYGETFELTGEYASDITQVYNKSKELETRFTFALFAADHSYDVAEASGLTITDPVVKKNERYLYRIYANVPEDKLAIDTAFVYIGLADYVPLPKPTGIEAQFGNKVAVVSWDWAKVQDFYNSFILERSDDGGSTYAPVTDTPIINSEEDGKMTPPKMIFIDSLGQNNTEVFYRVKGISIFGEYSPTSDIVSGIPRPLLREVPEVASAIVDENGVLLKWNFQGDPENPIQGFRLFRAGKFNGEYDIVFNNIPPDKREIRHTNPPSSSNYYSISAFDSYGNETVSLPVFAAVEDSIPPLAPVGLTGKIDSVGVVTLDWQPNNEEDLAGYRVYRANFIDEEFGLVTKEDLTLSEYNDTVSVKTLTKSVFYKITAFDKHFNPSEFSEIIEIKRPDINPPATPIFKSVQSKDDGIYLQWISSASKDAVLHMIYRKSAGETYWEPIARISDFEIYNTYVDSLAEPGQYYQYTMLAIDDSNLESEPAKPVGVRRTDNVTMPVVEKIFAQADRENKKIILAWEYPTVGVEKMLIYRGIESGKMNLYESLDIGEVQFEDTDIKVNTIYKYRIQAQFKNGALTPFSTEVIVNY